MAIYVVYGTRMLEDLLKQELRSPDIRSRFTAFDYALSFAPLPHTKSTRQYQYTQQELEKVAALACLDEVDKIRELGFRYYQIAPSLYKTYHRKALEDRKQCSALGYTANEYHTS
jgi:hypothetical protein